MSVNVSKFLLILFYIALNTTIFLFYSSYLLIAFVEKKKIKLIVNVLYAFNVAPVHSRQKGSSNWSVSEPREDFTR